MPIIVKQPTNDAEMLNYLLPTKQSGNSIHAARITQNGHKSLNDFDHWHTSDHNCALLYNQPYNS